MDGRPRPASNVRRFTVMACAIPFDLPWISIGEEPVSTSMMLEDIRGRAFDQEEELSRVPITDIQIGRGK